MNDLFAAPQRVLRTAVAGIRAQGRPLAAGPWEQQNSLTVGPSGWFSVGAQVLPTGFRVGRKIMSMNDLAWAIWHCPRWRGRPVLLVGPADETAAPLLTALVATLGTPVYTADDRLRLTFGRAVTAGHFWCWRPGAGQPERVGRFLPPVGSVRPAAAGRRARPGAAPRPAPAAPALSPPPPGDRPAEQDTQLASTAAPGPGVADGAAGRAAAAVVPQHPAGDGLLPVAAALSGGVPALPRFDLGVGRPAVLPAEGGPVLPAEGGPVGPADSPAPTPGAGAPTATGERGPGARDRRSWFALGARTEEQDRERMRAVLDWKFQAYTRTATRALSLYPGLRKAIGGHDVMAGLIGVLALLDGAADGVNAALRGAAPPEQTAALLARCAAAGLIQLPSVTGAVFAAPSALDIEAYRVGELLVEPGFLPVSPTAGTGGYAIWSATARRLDLLGIESAMFTAGTRFAVLDVVAEQTPCVLLREVVHERADEALDQKIIAKLREAVPARQTPATLPWPIGLDTAGRPFAPRPVPETA